MESPRAYAEKILSQPQLTEPFITEKQKEKVFENLKQMVEERKNIAITKKHEQKVKQACERGNMSSIPYFDQDIAFKMIKITDINHEFWNLSNTVQTAYNYLIDQNTDILIPSGIRNYVKKPTRKVLLPSQTSVYELNK